MRTARSHSAGARQPASGRRSPILPRASPSSSPTPPSPPGTRRSPLPRRRTRRPSRPSGDRCRVPARRVDSARAVRSGVLDPECLLQASRDRRHPRRRWCRRGSRRAWGGRPKPLLAGDHPPAPRLRQLKAGDRVSVRASRCRSRCVSMHRQPGDRELLDDRPVSPAPSFDSPPARGALDDLLLGSGSELRAGGASIPGSSRVQEAVDRGLRRTRGARTRSAGAYTSSSIASPSAGIERSGRHRFTTTESRSSRTPHHPWSPLNLGSAKRQRRCAARRMFPGWRSKESFGEFTRR